MNNKYRPRYPDAEHDKVVDVPYYDVEDIGIVLLIQVAGIVLVALLGYGFFWLVNLIYTHTMGIV